MASPEWTAPGAGVLQLRRVLGFLRFSAGESRLQLHRVDPNDEALDALQHDRKLDESPPGYGFGPPITRELAELYGGDLELSRSDLGGVEARLTLPAAR